MFGVQLVPGRVPVSNGWCTVSTRTGTGKQWLCTVSTRTGTGKQLLVYS